MPFVKGDKNINRGGRRPGATQKAPKDGEIEELFARGAKEAIHLLFKMMRDEKASETTRFKVASKFIDSHLTIEKQGGKLRVEQEDKQGNRDAYEVEEEQEQEQRANGTTGKVVNFRKLVSTEYKEKDSDLKEKKSEEDSE